MESARVLVIDDDPWIGRIFKRTLEGAGYEVHVMEALPELEEAIRTRDFDAVVTDLHLGGFTGLDVTRKVLDARPGVPVVVMTADKSLEAAVGAIRAGAFDYLPKPFDVELAKIVVERAVRVRRLHEDLKRLEGLVEQRPGFGDLVGESPAMSRLASLLTRVRGSDVSVLVTGESGTGKELVARALHRSGRRSSGPFVAINCAALPEPLLESELFGHVKGAFTDARTARTGLFVQANGGTLFLDEVGELPAGVQAKLLRALQDRMVRPVGSDREQPFDARIVAATNRDLVGAVERGTFREDLFFRLNVLEVEVPPLRDRGNDVLLLAHHFLAQSAASAGKAVSRLSRDAAEKLLAYNWPGNVRELRNCIERAVALAEFDAVTVEDLPTRVRNHTATTVALVPEDPGAFPTLEEVEKRYILKVYEAVGRHRGRAAKVLGLDRKTLYRKLAAWGAGGPTDDDLASA